MNRVDLYHIPHRAIRALLFDTTLLFGRTDFAIEAEARLAISAGERLLGFLHEHAEHEDAAMLPEIEALSPELAAELRVSGVAEVLRYGRAVREAAKVSGTATAPIGPTCR